MGIINLFLLWYVAGGFVYTLGPNGSVGDVHLISDVFPGVEPDLDEAVYAPNKKTYFFKVSKQLVFNW